MHKFYVFSFVFCSCIIMSLGIYTLFFEKQDSKNISNSHISKQKSSTELHDKTKSVKAIKSSNSYYDNDHMKAQKQIPEQQADTTNNKNTVVAEEKKKEQTKSSVLIEPKFKKSNDQKNIQQKSTTKDNARSDKDSDIKPQNNEANVSKGLIKQNMNKNSITNNNDAVYDKKILTIILDQTLLKSEPKKVCDPIERLPLNSKCEILNKLGPKTIHLDDATIPISDYFYYVICNTKKGWVFGYYTSLRLQK